MDKHDRDADLYHAKARACDERAQDQHASRRQRETYRQAAMMWREMARQAALEEALGRVISWSEQAPGRSGGAGHRLSDPMPKRPRPVVAARRS
jgi:hypothetical protein